MFGAPPFWNKERVQPFVGKRVIVTYWSAPDVSAGTIGIMTSADDVGITITAIPNQRTQSTMPLPVLFPYDKISTIVEDTSTVTTQAGLFGNSWAIAAIVLGGALLYNYSKNPKRAE